MNGMDRFVLGVFLLFLASEAWADAAGDYQTLFGEQEKATLAKGDIHQGKPGEILLSGPALEKARIPATWLCRRAAGK